MHDEHGNDRGHNQTHRDLTALSITVGRLDERMRAVQDHLVAHIKEEEDLRKEEMKKVEVLNDLVRELYAAARVTRWIAAGVSAFVGLAIWLKDHVSFIR